LARSAPATLVVVNELYVAFTGQTVVPEALELPNVVTLQSLSKAAGIAAIRLGFAIGHPSIVERLRRVTGPYDVNMFAVVAGKAVIDGSFRLTIGTRQDMRRFAAAFASAIAVSRPGSPAASGSRAWARRRPADPSPRRP